MDQDERREYRSRMQNARSALYLLCDNATVELADKLSQRLHQIDPATNKSFVAATDEMFTLLVREIRAELGGSSVLIVGPRRTDSVTPP
jgi:hypothetical protein